MRPEPTTTRRYAVYFAPAQDSALWHAGSRWLGRDAATGAALEQPAGNGIDPGRLAEITAAPRLYGFHATLKPPFRLKDGTDEAALTAAVEEFASRQSVFSAGRLGVGRLGRFLALVLTDGSSEMNALAGATVRELDVFRAPPDRGELDRRRQAGLTPRQEAHLVAWGYPYVMDEFRFHMSLTGAFDDDLLRDRIEDALKGIFAPITADPLVVDAVCLFRQEERRAPFLLTGRFPLGSSAKDENALS